jgi:hypothetical protein
VNLLLGTQLTHHQTVDVAVNGQYQQAPVISNLKCGVVAVVEPAVAAANMAILVEPAHMWLKLCAATISADANIQFAQAEPLQHHQTVLDVQAAIVMYRAFN